MPDLHLPLVVEPEVLEPLLGTDGLLLVDLCKPAGYPVGHIPGAVSLRYGDIVADQRPVGGLLPDAARLGTVLSALGLTPEHWVVAYDDEGGGRAGRLLWTLHALGHRRVSILNGGMHAWANEGHRLERGVVSPVPAQYTARIQGKCVADAAYILERLGTDDIALLDTRTPQEFTGEKRFAARGGHIPGAVNMDWVLAMDPGRNLRLRADGELREMLEGLGVRPEREVIVYCQTHHRSSHTYTVLKYLDYPRVRGYHGAWSEWGNRQDTPVE